MKRSLLSLMTVAVVGLLMSACSSPQKMVDAANQVQPKCEPEVLECVADNIDARYSLTFPEKYFHPKGVLEIIPVLVYEGGEEVGPSKWLQGESVSDNYQVIPQTGGNFTQAVQFKYKDGMQVAHLELRAKLHYKGKSVDFPVPYKVADGTIITYKLVEMQGAAALAADAYKKSYTQTKEAQINYLINSSQVRSQQLTKEDIKALEQFLADVDKDAKKKATGTDIVSYASPDGPVDLNTKLSADRGKTAKAALDQATKKVKTKGPVNITSKGEDWDGFQQMVSSSNIQDKELVLRVLSMYSDPVVRDREIKNMSKVYQVLADKVLPELRRSKLVATVEVANYSDQELTNMVSQNNMEALDVEALLYAATLVQDDATKLKVLNKAAEKYNDWRAYNNIAYINLNQGKLAEAKAAMAKVTATNDIVNNNNAVIALREGRTDDASALFAKSSSAQSKENQGAISILKGTYPDAVSKLAGTNTFNEALANVLVKDYTKATNILKNLNTPKAAYLRAVIAARNGNASQVSSEIKTAYNDATLKARAAKDIEFAKVKSSL